MIAIIYKFEIEPNSYETFVTYWKQMTELIHTYENGLGSRLHKQDECTYIAYAQWPDVETWKTSGGNLPEEAKKVRDCMRKVCRKVEVLYELEVTEDLLKE